MTRTDENAHYYYFTESLPHMNLTRVGMGGHLAAMQLLCVTSGNPRSLRPLLCGNGRKEDCCGWPSKPLSVRVTRFPHLGGALPALPSTFFSPASRIVGTAMTYFSFRFIFLDLNSL
jgi:hypothetical protein